MRRPSASNLILIESGRTQMLTAISIYSQCGATRDQVRLFYMDATVFRIWKAMGRNPKVVGDYHRPPQTALLM